MPDWTIGVTTSSFSKDQWLIAQLRKSFKEIFINEGGKRLSRGELVALLRKCDAAIVGIDAINGDILSQCPRLKRISKFGVGLDNIDFEACGRHGVEVLHRQGVNRRSVSEMTLGFMLSLVRNLYVTSNQHKRGRWNKQGGIQLSGKTVGIIGVGHIGKDLVTLLKPFGCTILGNDIIEQSEYYRENNVVEASKEEIYRTADIITVHTPLTGKTRGLINKETLAMMKSTAYVINTARGGIINEAHLKAALENGEIAGAAMDVYEVEPPVDSELLELENLFCTPHIGGNSREAVEAMGLAAIDNLREAALVNHGE